MWPADEKRKIIAESFAPGASVAQVAQRYGLNANMLFTWRRPFRPILAAESVGATQLVPVSIAPEPSPIGGAWRSCSRAGSASVSALTWMRRR